jgi:hypothetical protein
MFARLRVSMANDKPKRKRLPKPPKPPFQPLRPEQVTDGRISMVHERLIGRVVSRWAKLEAAMSDLIILITGLNFEDGRLFTERQDATRLIAILRTLAERYLSDEGTPSPRSKFLDTLDKIEHLKEDRNNIVHGSWGEIDGVPIMLSLRAKNEDPKNITGETYPRHRMNGIADGISGCIQIIVIFRRIFELSREKHSK